MMRLERNGVYLDLNSGSAGGTYFLTEYAPAAPETTLFESVNALRDGGELPLVLRRNVTETAGLVVKSATPATAQAAVQTLETWLRYAEEYQRSRAGYPVYVELQPGGTTGVYRSELLSGRVLVAGDGLGPWARGWVELSIVWMRRCYWEGDEAELPLQNIIFPSNYGTGGITIGNTYDTNYRNCVTIRGPDIGGVIPAPMRVELTNTFASIPYATTIYMGQGALNYNGTMLEAEALSHGGSGSTASATCSNGGYETLTLSGSSGSVAVWTLSSATLETLAGRSYRMIARVLAPRPVGAELSLEVRYPDHTYAAISQTPAVVVADTNLIELGTLQLPPWLDGYSGAKAPVDVVLCGSLSGGGTLLLDYIAMLPTDTLRVFQPAVYGLVNGQTLVDDGITQQLYVTSAGSASGLYTGYGDRPVAWPGVGSTLYFLEDDSSIATVARSSTVRVYYRPRRWTL